MSIIDVIVSGMASIIVRCDGRIVMVGMKPTLRGCCEHPVLRIQRSDMPLQIFEAAGVDEDVVGDGEALFAGRLRGDHLLDERCVDAVAAREPFAL